MGQLVCLHDFRERNGLSQVELARLLGISAAYLSSVESKNGKLSQEKMRKLWALCEEKPWFWDDLVPAHTRLVEIWHDIHKSYHPKRNSSDAPISQEATGVSHRDSLIKKFEEDFSQAVPEAVRERIRLGQQGIDSILAERVISILPPGYRIEKEWLLTGELPMHPEDVVKVDDPDAMKPFEWNEPAGSGDQLDTKAYALLQVLLQKQEELKQMVDEIRTLLMKQS